MKAIGRLYDQIGTHANLSAAAWRAAQGKRHRPEVAAWLAQADQRIAAMAEALAEGSYEFSRYSAFAIRDPKSRIIHAPAFADRVLHHALIAVAGPVLESGASYHSYGCRKGKGQHAAVRQVRAWLRPEDWFLKMDVEKYYDSVLHVSLMQSLRRRFRERRLLRLWAALLGSYATAPGRGLPIGALTSQYLGNFYLDPVDHFLSAHHSGLRHCRYMDDFLVLGSHSELLPLREQTAAFLEGRGLRLKHGGTLNRASLGVPFLGFTIYPDRVRLNAPGRQRLRRQLRTLERTTMDEATLQSRGTALCAHAQHADDIAHRRMMVNLLPSSFIHPISPSGERLGLATRHPGRLVQQHGQEVSLRQPQQEPSWQPQQEPGLPPLLVLRHGGTVLPPDDASSSASAVHPAEDKTNGKSPSTAEICAQQGTEKAVDGAVGKDERRNDDL